MGLQARRGADVSNDYDGAADSYRSLLYAIAVLRARLPHETRTADEIFKDFLEVEGDDD